jgi:hypothetical protein
MGFFANQMGNNSPAAGHSNWVATGAPPGGLTGRQIIKDLEELR